MIPLFLEHRYGVYTHLQRINEDEQLTSDAEIQKTMDYVTLNNGVKMPQLGYGVYQTPPEETERCVLAAIKKRIPQH